MKKGMKDASTTGGVNSKWYEEYPKTQEPYAHSKSDVEVLDLKAEGKRYLDADTAAFQLKQSKSRDSEIAWIRTALTKGTTSDKIAAGIVLVQDNPKYNVARLVSLVGQVKVTKHNQCNMIITSMRDLFLSDLLHPNYKLSSFQQQNLDKVERTASPDRVINTEVSRKKLLSHWYFEDQLREQYQRFVTYLGAIASDTVDTNRETAISVMTDLLVGNAEQEQKLLELIVNKVGDPSNKVGSKAIFCLTKLLHEHPNMKLVVLREIEKLLFRKNVAPRAQYYAICLLTQFLLGKNDEEIAGTLIQVYFAFFKACLKKGEPDSRMMAAILTGVNRAYPFAKIDSNILQNHIDSVYKVVHVGSFNVSLNALSLLHQVTGKDVARANRFYSAFYRKLLDPQIAVAKKRALFLNLLHRVLQNDRNVPRLYAFIKRILQVALYFPANMACATLYVVSKVLRTRKEVKNLLLKPRVGIKIENDEDEIRMIQDDSSNSSDEIKEEDDEPNVENTEDSIVLSNIVMDESANAKTEADIKRENEIKSEPIERKEYDPLCRNPLYAGVTKGVSPELLNLSKHFHPSVVLFANTILQGKPIDYTGDPLEDLALMRFLDRYVFKNPKKLEAKKVQRRNDPLAQRAGYTPKGIRGIPVDSASYVKEREERIPVDELYLYRYLKRRNEFERRPIEARHDEDDQNDQDDDDLESVNSEEFNDVLDRLANGSELESLDIASDLQMRKNKKKNEEDDQDLGEDESDDADDENFEIDSNEDRFSDDESQDFSDIDLDAVDDEDLSDMDFNHNSDDDGADNLANSKNKKGIDNNIFVSAEKFAEMLEEHGKQKRKIGGTDTLSSADGASSKQIDWEIKRHQKLRGTFERNKRKGSTFKKNLKRPKH